jgi:hypothetical protein
MLRIRTMIALAVLGALAVVALAIPAMANDDNDRTDHQRSGGGLDRSSLGSGGKLTLKLLERGEAQTLAEIYASEDTGKKVERAMRRGLVVHCQPGGYDTLSFTCEGTPPPLETTVPETTTLETTTPPATASTPATASAPATTP